MDAGYKGDCEIISHNCGVVIDRSKRKLLEKGSDVFIRYQLGVSVFRKVRGRNETTVSSIASIQRPFGMRTFVHGSEKQTATRSIKLYERGGVGYISEKDVTVNADWVGRPKVLISAAYNAGDAYPHQILGRPIYAEKGSACTETYMVFGPFESKTECVNFISYVKTRFFRFLVWLKKSSQHAPASVYQFVPMQDYKEEWDDEKLYKKYKLTKDEIAFIESMIKPME